MPKEPNREHDAAVRELLLAGHSDAAVQRKLGVSNRPVRRVRDELGLPPSPGARTTPMQKVARFSLPPDEGGHTRWTGRLSGTVPTIRQGNKPYSAARLVFEQRAARPAVGQVMADCGVQGCLTAWHLTDELERRRTRMSERLLWGLEPQPWVRCPAGRHDWDEDGRLYPDLRPYCNGCNIERADRARNNPKGT